MKKVMLFLAAIALAVGVQGASIEWKMGTAIKAPNADGSIGTANAGAGTLSMYEGAFAGTAYSLALGVVCDLLLPGPIPCFYTLVFPLAGLCAGLMARNWLPAGFPCCLAASAVAFLLTDAFHCLLLAFRGEFCSAALVAAAAETCLTLCFSPAVLLLFRPIHRKCHLDD